MIRARKRPIPFANITTRAIDLEELVVVLGNRRTAETLPTEARRSYFNLLEAMPRENGNSHCVHLRTRRTPQTTLRQDRSDNRHVRQPSGVKM